MRPGSESALRFMRPPRRNFSAFAPELGDELLQVLDLLFGRVAAVAAGVVDGDVVAVPPPKKSADRPLRGLAQQFEQSHLDRRDADPQSEALQLVVVCYGDRRPRAALSSSRASSLTATSYPSGIRGCWP